MLDLVGLADAADRHAGAYSLGMRQRLGLAAALLGDPPVLVLDEPGNGLDPQGIRDLRDLLRARAAAGGTVFVSSHLLAEVEHLADEVVVLNHGRLVTTGLLSDLQQAGIVGAHTVARAADRRALRAPAAPCKPQPDRELLVRGMTIDADRRPRLRGRHRPARAGPPGRFARGPVPGLDRRHRAPRNRRSATSRRDRDGEGGSPR